MPIIDGMNDDYIEYFSLEEYINKEDILQECSNNFTLEERLRYGLSISNEEYSRIINARNNIETKILER